VKVKRFADHEDYNRTLDGDADLHDHSGRLVLALRRGAVSAAAWELALESVCRAARPGDPGRGRKVAAGGQPNFLSGAVGCMHGGLTSGTRGTRADLRGWHSMRMLLQEMNTVFRREYPVEYAAHCEAVRGIRALVPHTAFSTVQCNRTDTEAGVTARMAYHPDGHNVTGAYGVMSVWGRFTGGLLVFPRFRVAVDLHPGDVLIADNTELHGNTRIVGTRLSVVAYAHASNIKS
jgi:hypothetical protein